MRARYLLMVALVIGLGGCVTNHPTVLADGSQGQIIKCNGIEHSVADCYEKAGEICPKGYDVVGANGESFPVGVQQGSFTANPSYASGSYYGFQGEGIHRSIMVRCH